MNYEYALQILYAGVGAIGFALLFHVRGKRMPLSALGGALAWGAYLLGEKLTGSSAVGYFIGAMAGTVFAELLARIVRTPATVFMVTSIIPLVPGASLFYCMRSMMNGDYAAFVDRGVYTLSAAGAIALGIFFSTMVFRLIFPRFRGKRSAGYRV